MCEILKIKNFKCFREQNIQLNGLTVLVGSNGMGKSTVVQSILLLRQCVENKSDKILLNGPYALALGTFTSVISHDADGEMSFTLSTNKEEILFDVVLKGTNEEETYSLRKITKTDAHQKKGLLADTFYFLSAERTGPRISQNLVDFNFPACGVLGEHTAQLLSQQYTKVLPERKHPDCTSNFLKDQINAWINQILPGNSVTAEANIKLQKAQVLLKNRISDSFVESTNLGFGISYCLPIIVTGLIAEKGSFVVIENPEAHLHPAAQTAMGKFLAFLSSVGLRVVVETHSDHILDGIQIYLARNQQLRNQVVINNFGFSESGSLKVVPIVYNDNIEYSAWPKGFMDSSFINYSEFVKTRSI